MSIKIKTPKANILDFNVAILYVVLQKIEENTIVSFLILSLMRMQKIPIISLYTTNHQTELRQVDKPIVANCCFSSKIDQLFVCSRNPQ